MFESLKNTFVVLVHSKRAWATFTSILTTIGGMLFPQYLTGCLVIVGVLQSWVVGETYRPASLKNAPVEPESKQTGFVVPDEVLNALRETMVRNAMAKISDLPVVTSAEESK
jgi:hypothetical protein